jgi:hypothetical protein
MMELDGFKNTTGFFGIAFPSSDTTEKKKDNRNSQLVGTNIPAKHGNEKIG